MGRLEKFERQQRVKKMNEIKAAERSANQQKAAEQFKTITQAVGRYKNWAMSRSTGKGRVLACAAPVLAPLVLLIGLGMAAPSPEPEAQTAKPVEAGTEKAPLPTSGTVKAESVEVEASPEPVEPAEETPAPAPLSYEEQIKEDIRNNTPGLFAIEAIDAIPAEKLANDILPVACDALASNLTSDVKIVLADAALKNWGTDEKTSENIAEGIILTALEPGRC